MEALIRLRQTDFMEEYKVKFEALSIRLRGLLENYKLICLLSGLIDEIRLPIKMFNPTIMLVAYGLAQETRRVCSC